MALLFATVTVQEILRTRLQRQGITERDLQETLGIERTMANMILNGKRKIAARHFDQLPKLFAMPLWEIFDDRDLTSPTVGASLGTHTTGVSIVRSPDYVDPRIQKLEAERDELRDRIDNIERVTRALFAAVRPAKEDETRRGDKPRRGRPRGKTAR